MKHRIWELDALRGLCILGMVVFHFIFDLTELYRIVDWTLPPVLMTVQIVGGLVFFLISGTCVTLGRRCIRRGLTVFACGMIVSAVTYGMYKLDFSDISIIIYFGVLHCLGICMLLWPLFKKAPTWLLGVMGIVFIALGYYFSAMPKIESRWLMPLGIYWEGFASSDYYPLFPHLGYFLLGAVAGRTLYRKKTTRIPQVDPRHPLPAFLQLCGRHSLWIYLIHQPVLNGICMLLLSVK